MQFPPPKKKVRDSNIELYRIIVMLMIVAHHYVVNSGLFEVLRQSPMTSSSCAMLIFGAWGKTGINCFLLITGYFMCKSDFSWQKLLKLNLQIALYAIIIYCVFCFTDHDQFTIAKALWHLWPLKGFTQNFTSCFLMFYMFIPFLNIFIKHLERKQHLYLIILLLVFYGLLPSVPVIKMDFNYVSWFMAIYLMAAYVRLYGLFPKITHKMWGIISLGLIITGISSVLLLEVIYKWGYISHYVPYFFISDSNKILSVMIAVSSFMYFKDLKFPHSQLINAIGEATFGVLLIHANSDTMRQWLWKETIDCTGHYGTSPLQTLSYATASVMAIFIVCAAIDWFIGKYIEKHLVSFFWQKGMKIKNRLDLSSN